MLGTNTGEKLYCFTWKMIYSLVRHWEDNWYLLASRLSGWLDDMMLCERKSVQVSDLCEFKVQHPHWGSFTLLSTPAM